MPADQTVGLSDLVNDLFSKTDLAKTSGNSEQKKNRLQKMKKMMKAQADALDLNADSLT